MIEQAEARATAPAAERDSQESTTEATRIGLAFYVRLRFVFVAFAALGLAVAALVFDAALPVAALVVCLAVAFGSNLWLGRVVRKNEPTGAFLGAVLTFDTLLLTAGLGLSGGAQNPFTALLLVYVALAAAVLGSRWAFAIAGLAVACFGSLFLVPPSGGGGMHAHHHAMGHDMHAAMGHEAHAAMGHEASAINLHLYGMLVAFAATAAFTSYLVTRVTRALAERDAALERARTRAARTERLAALTTLAAGAAHEMGTPLGTIAVIAGELEHHARDLTGSAEVADDARLIRAEVDRCRTILDQLTQAAGESRGEAPLRVPVADVIAEVVARLPEDRAKRLVVEVAEGVRPVLVPKSAFAQVIRNLVTNAFDASDDAASVTLGVSEQGDRVVFVVVDRGAGMSEAELERLVEPFYTTKPAGRGMGLGLFLSRAVAEQLGGALVVESVKGRGTTARLEVPR